MTICCTAALREKFNPLWVTKWATSSFITSERTYCISPWSFLFSLRCCVGLLKLLWHVGRTLADPRHWGHSSAASGFVAGFAVWFCVHAFSQHAHPHERI